MKHDSSGREEKAISVLMLNDAPAWEMGLKKGDVRKVGESIARSLISSGFAAECEDDDSRITIEEIMRLAKFDGDTPKDAYLAYLESAEWKERRREHIRIADGKCQICNSSDRLQVHHRSYERLGRELFSDLVVLCKGCHTIFHELGKLKTL